MHHTALVGVGQRIGELEPVSHNLVGVEGSGP